MIALYKALVPGALFTWIVAMVLVSGGTSGGALSVHMVHFQSISFPWSWMLFLGGTALSWFILQSLD